MRCCFLSTVCGAVCVRDVIYSTVVFISISYQSESCEMKSVIWQVVIASLLPPVGVEVFSLILLCNHRGKRTNIAISMGTTAVTMAIMVSMGMSGRGGLGQRRTHVSDS